MGGRDFHCLLQGMITRSWLQAYSARSLCLYPWSSPFPYPYLYLDLPPCPCACPFLHLCTFLSPGLSFYPSPFPVPSLAPSPFPSLCPFRVPYHLFPLPSLCLSLFLS